MLQVVRTAAVVWGMSSFILAGTWAGLHYVLGDELLFHSDYYSLGVYLAACGSVFGGAVGLLWLTMALVFRRFRPWPYELFLFTCMGAFVALPLFLYVEQRWPVLWSAAFALALTLPLVVLTAARTDRRDVIRRLENIGLTACLLLNGGTLLALAVNHGSTWLTRGARPPKHVVLMVIDGLPTQYLRAYRSSAEPTAMDSLLRESWVFEQARTTLPYTPGFFGVLYTASSRFDHVGGRVPPEICDDNLLYRLQRHGVAARWLAFHRNGMPEGSVARCDRYAGLRSYFLSEDVCWIPAWLGLDYHVSLGSGAIMRNLRGPHARRLYYRINSAAIESCENSLLRVLLPQVLEQRRRNDRSFTLLHTDVKLTSGSNAAVRAGLTEQDWTFDEERGAKKRREEAARVSPDEKSELQALREAMREAVTTCAQDVDEFFQAVRRLGLLSNTSFIVTADHGLIFDKGRLWKAYHPNPEVVRVPFFIVGNHSPRFDQRPIATKDVHVSLLDAFEIPVSASGPGHSIFSDARARYTATLTKIAPAAKEWFLVVAKDGKTYQANIHPQGNGAMLVTAWDDYDEKRLSQGKGPHRAIRPLLPDVRREFALDEADIHPAFR